MEEDGRKCPERVTEQDISSLEVNSPDISCSEFLIVESDTFAAMNISEMPVESVTYSFSESDTCSSPELVTMIYNERIMSSHEKETFESVTTESASSSPEVVFHAKEDNTQAAVSSPDSEISRDVKSDDLKSPEHVRSNDGSDGFENVDNEIPITEELIASLLERFKKKQYSAASADVEDAQILTNCLRLFQKDYICKVTPNPGGVLCVNYPAQIVLTMKEKHINYEDYDYYKESCTSKFDAVKYRELAAVSHFSRCRVRFPVPVMMLEGKFVCRSATLAVRKGAAVESLRQPEEPKAEIFHDGVVSWVMDSASKATTSVFRTASNISAAGSMLLQEDIMTRLKESDIKLLQCLGVDYICDLMVEDSKMYSGIRVSSSEKINRQLYGIFKIAQIPYPGCEFFAEYHEANRNPEGLNFDWSDPAINAEFKMPEDMTLSLPDTDFSNYKLMDLVQLTKAYLSLLLTFVTSGKKSVLVHCISGWDRTALFISLLRLSLWADGWIHESLTPVEIAYLTVGYDWYLFGHELPKRLHKKEEIMHFCFNFIRYMTSDEFSMTKEWHARPTELKGNRRVPSFIPGNRMKKLGEVHEILLRLYDDQIDLTHD